jgi:putative tricarboxylic transport membrane protein
MEGTLDSLLLGFSVAFRPDVLWYAFLGCLVGTLVGVLPGIGPLAAIAMLLPATFTLPPVGALIMLAGIYYGAQYGGSTTAILVNLPGESSSAVTAIDGRGGGRPEMAQGGGTDVSGLSKAIASASDEVRRQLEAGSAD